MRKGCLECVPEAGHQRNQGGLCHQCYMSRMCLPGFMLMVKQATWELVCCRHGKEVAPVCSLQCRTAPTENHPTCRSTHPPNQPTPHPTAPPAATHQVQHSQGAAWL
jgi:hypothetical protein